MLKHSINFGTSGPLENRLNIKGENLEYIKLSSNMFLDNLP